MYDQYGCVCGYMHAFVMQHIYIYIYIYIINVYTHLYTLVCLCVFMLAFIHVRMFYVCMYDDVVRVSVEQFTSYVVKPQ